MVSKPRAEAAGVETTGMLGRLNTDLFVFVSDGTNNTTLSVGTFQQSPFTSEQSHFTSEKSNFTLEKSHFTSEQSHITIEWTRKTAFPQHQRSDKHCGPPFRVSFSEQGDAPLSIPGGGGSLA
jgi:hypothetical protein